MQAPFKIIVLHRAKSFDCGDPYELVLAPMHGMRMDVKLVVWSDSSGYHFEIFCTFGTRSWSCPLSPWPGDTCPGWPKGGLSISNTNQRAFMH